MGRGCRSSAELVLDIPLEAGSLVAYEHAKAMPLLWLEDHTFYWQGAPVTVIFDADGSQLRIDSTRRFGQMVSLDRVP